MKGHAKPKQRRRSDRKDAVTFFAGSVCRYDIVLNAATDMGWKMVRDNASPTEKRNCNVYWIDTSNINDFYQTIQPWQCINHFPGMTNIARKARMCQNLEVMKRKFPHEYAFYPRTYCLPREMPLFRKNFGPDGKSNIVFIIKPDGGCQGRGIFLTRDVNDVHPSSLCVAQHYILNPLLIDNKKFDLRIYVLVTSCKPLRIYLFRDGLVRICAEEFVRPNTANLEQRCIHLTNYAVNKSSEKFVGIDPTGGDGDTIGKDGNKRSIRWFLQWLQNERGEASVESLWKRIGHICAATILSVSPLLIREYNTVFGVIDKLSEARMKADSETCRRSCSEFGDPDVELAGQSVSDVADAPSIEDEAGDESNNSCAAQPMTAPPDNIGADTASGKGSEQRLDVGGSRCFEILGFDIMVDNNCRPILIELNHLPSFGADCPVDRSVKKRLLEQVLATVKARAQDAKVYEEYTLKESKDRLRGGKRIISEAAIRDPRNTNCADYPHNLKNRGSEVNNSAADNDTVAFAKQELINIYSECAPSHVERIPALLCKYKGYETWLVAKAREKYIERRLVDMTGAATDAPFISASKLENVGPPDGQGVHTDERNSPEVSPNVDCSNLSCPQDTEDIPEADFIYADLRNSQLDSSLLVEASESSDSLGAPTVESASVALSNGRLPVPMQELADSTKIDANPGSEYDRLLHDVFLEEERALEDFDRIYPPLELSANYQKFKEMERYIFDEYEKQHKRLTAPLHQLRSYGNEASLSDEHATRKMSSTNSSNATWRPGFELDRRQSWILGNPHIRRSTYGSPPKELPFPTQKQIEAATRLSRRRNSKTRRETHTNSSAEDALGADSDVGPKLSDHTNLMQARNTSTIKACTKEPVAPVNFEFGSLENCGGSGHRHSRRQTL